MRWSCAVVLCLFEVSLAQHAQEKNPLAGNAGAVEAGRKLYAQACRSCHAAGRAARAPDLSTGVFARGRDDGEIFLNIRSGIPGTEMPPFSGLGTEQVWQLVAYIRSLSGAAAPRDSDTLRGDPAAGAALFDGKGACRGCHEVNGRGGIAGPDLSAVGRNSEAFLRDAILTPNAAAGARARGRGGRQAARTVIARAADGREIRGVPRGEDTYSLQLVDASGRLHLLDKLKLVEVRPEARSLMPDDYGTRLSDREVRDLVAYLGTLTARDSTRTASAPVLPGGLTFERLRNARAEPHNWLMYWGDYQGTHFSPLEQITPGNVRGLAAQWAMQMPGESILQTTPVVVDGVLYTSGPPGQVFALDARTGKQIWKYQRAQKTTSPYEMNRFARGVAVLGQRVFFGTLDAALVALDARTGLELWETPLADVREGYSITCPPLALKDRIIVGISGGEFGIRGFVDAYDPADGERLWRFYTIPGPGEFGSDTWHGDSWKRGAGAPWLTGSYDPELDLLYWAVGNPGPDIDGDVRKGDNLFTNSVVALDPATGRRRWHYQFTPHDTHDWDSTEDMVLVDRPFRGRARKLLLHADRNGFFYVLDRTTGEFLSATPFVRQTWAKGFDAQGRPVVVPESNATREGSIPVFPNLGGGTNFQAPSYDAARGWLFLAYQDAGQRFFVTPETFESGKQYMGGRSMGVDEPSWAGIKAIDPETGQTRWDYRIHQGSLNNGVLATGGGVLFAGTREGNLIALDSTTGKFLWRFQAGGTMAASPISYAVDGRQFVAVAAGAVLYSFALPE